MVRGSRPLSSCKMLGANQPGSLRRTARACGSRLGSRNPSLMSTRQSPHLRQLPASCGRAGSSRFQVAAGRPGPPRLGSHAAEASPHLWTEGPRVQLRLHSSSQHPGRPG